MKKYSIAAIAALCLFAMQSGVGYSAEEKKVEELPFVEGKTPPKAEPGSAWCLVTKAATYREVTQKVEISPASYYMETVPAKYEEKEAKIMVAPEKKRPIVTPAEYKTTTEKVLVTPATFRYEIVPAKWEWVEQQVEVSPTTKQPDVQEATYKLVKETIETAPERDCVVKTKCDKGKTCYAATKCPSKHVNLNKEVLATAEKVEHVTVPAEKATIRVRKLVQEEQAKKIPVPAVYEEVTKKVLVKAATVTHETIPAQFKTIKKLVMIEPEKTQRVDIPAKYEMVTTKVLDTPATRIWKKITNRRCRNVAQLANRYPSFPCFTPPAAE